jgi:hypothetical protein
VDYFPSFLSICCQTSSNCSGAEAYFLLGLLSHSVAHGKKDHILA